MKALRIKHKRVAIAKTLCIFCEMSLFEWAWQSNLIVVPWILLSIAIAAEIAGTLLLKASDGLSKLWPSIGVAIGYAIAFSLMAISLKKLEVGITYAIWSGVGIMGAAIGGVVFFDQHLSRLNIIGMVIIILGVVVMNLGGVAH